MSSAIEQFVAQALVIEKGVPIPPRTDPFSHPASRIHEAARSMEVGDSVVLPVGTKKSACGNMARTTGFKFTQRKQPDGTIQVWRIE